MDIIPVIPGQLLLVPMALLSILAYRLGRASPPRVSFSRRSACLSVILVALTAGMAALLSFYINELDGTPEKLAACLLVLGVHPAAWYLHGALLAKLESY